MNVHFSLEFCMSLSVSDQSSKPKISRLQASSGWQEATPGGFAEAVPLSCWTSHPQEERETYKFHHRYCVTLTHPKTKTALAHTCFTLCFTCFFHIYGYMDHSSSRNPWMLKPDILSATGLRSGQESSQQQRYQAEMPHQQHQRGGPQGKSPMAARMSCCKKYWWSRFWMIWIFAVRCCSCVLIIVLASWIRRFCG